MFDAKTAELVLKIWRDAGRGRWFRKDEVFDAELRRSCEAPHLSAAQGSGAGFGRPQGPHEALALVLLLDQIPRNIYRGTAHAFATDPLAREVSVQSLEAGWDRGVEAELRPFFYMPFVHAEDLAAQDRGLELFEGLAAELPADDYLRFARLHREVVLRFGRFPHRNGPLGRPTRPEEAAFLAAGGFSG